ncbi:MAG TPA: DNA polymerase Y family protein [Xanthomonadaceae bacterium]|nr:DNA polymerase Y family protein [Xanthomonadaceae bacterium]
MRWACLLLPHLALDAVLRRQPAPGQPFALVTGPAQRRVLHSVDPLAQANGLRPGLAVAAAQALGGNFAMAEYDAKATERCRRFLAGWAYRFSSQVSTALPGAIVLEIGQSRALFGEWPQLQARLREELGELGFRHRLAAAPNPHAAWALAQAHDGIGVDDAVLPRALGHLRVECAGLGDDSTQALQRMGLAKLRQLFALPRDTLARRFPATVLAQLDVLRGEMAPPLTCYRPPDHFDARIEFEQEVESSQAVLFPLRRLTADLGAFLAGRDGGVQRFALRLEHEGRPDTEVVVGLLAPERDPAMLFELARGRLEQARPPAPVRGLRLLARELPPFVPAGRDLFDARPKQAVPWGQLRERLRARLGDAAVQGIVVRADHRPEHATGTTSTAAPSFPRRRESSDAKWIPAFAGMTSRPGWLLARPLPLHDPARVLSGPERIESGWWDGGEVRRDYYVVETRGGQRAWAFRATGEQEGPFMLHGWFA